MADLITRYINPDGTRDYDSVEDWESDLGGATLPDLPNVNERISGVIEGDWSAEPACPGLLLNAWTHTSDDCRVGLSGVSEASHSGVWDDTKFRIESTGNGITIGSTVKHVSIGRIQIRYDTGDTGNYGIYGSFSGSISGRFSVQLCLIVNGGTTNGKSGIYFDGYGSGWQCVSNGNTVIGSKVGNAIHFDNCDDPLLYYNTVVPSGGTGIYVANVFSGGEAKCNLVKGGSPCFSGLASLADCDYNSSSDATADEGGGTHNYINQSYAFVDESGSDYHLLPTDTGAYAKGIEITVPIWLSTWDIDGEARVYFSIGSDDGPAPPPGASLVLKYVAESGGDYDSLYDWEADNGGATSSDLPTNNERIRAEVTGTWTASEITRLIISGITTDSTHWVEVEATGDSAASLDGWDTGAFRLDGSQSQMLYISVDHCRIKGIQIENTAANSYGIYINTASTGNCEYVIDSCRVQSDHTNGRYGIRAYHPSATSGYFKVINSIVSGWGYSAGRGIMSGQLDAIILNNVVYNCDYGISAEYTFLGSASIMENNIVSAHDVSCYLNTFRFAIEDYNIASDTTAAGSNSQNSVTPSFADAAGGDFTLQAGDTIARGAGDNLDAYFTWDMDGDTRPASPTAWDSGADHYISSVVYSDLTLAVSSSLATSFTARVYAGIPLSISSTLSLASALHTYAGLPVTVGSSVGIAPLVHVLAGIGASIASGLVVVPVLHNYVGLSCTVGIALDSQAALKNYAGIPLSLASLLDVAFVFEDYDASLPILDLSVPFRGWTVTGTPLVGQMQAGASAVLNVSSVSRLVGGSRSALDGIPTALVSTGARIVMRHAASGADLHYYLRAGTDSEVIPWTIRPDDYDIGTNAKVWVLTQVMKDGVICGYLGGSTNQFHRLFCRLDATNDVQLVPDETSPFNILS